MDGQTLMAIGAMAIAAISLLARLMDKSLSIREHDEFRSNIKDQFKTVIDQQVREIARIEDRIKSIEQTRPTTGEIAASLKRTSTGV